MADKEEITVERPSIIPHQAIVHIRAVVNQQMPNGQWHPRSVFNDGFFLRLEGSTENEVVDDLKKKLQELKNKWKEDGGQIGRIEN